jgi:hypothetical protein
MSRYPWIVGIILLIVLLASLTTPVAAQIVSVDPQPVPFPVLAGADFRIDARAEVTNRLFRVVDGELNLCSNSRGSIDIAPYCYVPDRHWGPVSVVSCSLEVSGAKPQTGFALPSRVALKAMPLGSTVTLRMLVQAPLIVLDLQGNPSAVLDTFVEEYRWTLTENQRP